MSGKRKTIFRWQSFEISDIIIDTLFIVLYNLACHRTEIMTLRLDVNYHIERVQYGVGIVFSKIIRQQSM